MTELQKRVITALIGGAIFIGALLFNAFSFWLLFTAIACLALLEFYKLFNTNGYSVSIAPALGIFLFSASTLFFADRTEHIKIIALMAVFMPSLLLLELFKKSSTPLQNFSLLLGGYGYIGLPILLSQQLVLQFEFGTNLILGVFILIWTNDSMAYFIGKKLGKRKLWERLSPKKTWEGFVGGLLFTGIAALILSHYFQFIPLSLWLFLGIIVSIIGTLGDLVESMLKRSLALKDSGSLLPGHGGFLDRFDSYLIAFPFVYFVVVLYFN